MPPGSTSRLRATDREAAGSPAARSGEGGGETGSTLLRRAVQFLQLDDAAAAREWAERALAQDPDSGMAWHVLAAAREKAGDLVGSLGAYEAALARLPDDSEVASDLGRLASRLGMKDVAEQLFRRYLANHPDAFGAVAALASVVRDQGRAGEAIDILKAALKTRPDEPRLWNTLGTVVAEQGDLETSILFFDEALRLDPAFAQARYHRSSARLELGELDGALGDCEQAIAEASAEEDRLMMRLARATVKLAQGRLGEGWDDYEARLAPLCAVSATFLIDRPRWTPDAPLAGKTLLLIGEQGLGDEVLFANVLPDVIEALGPGGKLLLAVEPRLAPLFRRSFPSAEVAPHVTYRRDGRNFRAAPALADRADIDLWAPLASPLRRFRRRLEDFPSGAGFLAPDSARVRHWRGLLERAPAGRKVGLLWKSMKIDADRARYYSPFQLWAPVLRTPGVAFVNIQYGDCAPELAWAARELGVEIWTPPGLDLKDDLDDVAALACALDLTLGFANATSNIAAACGAPTWIISAPGAWTRLGEADRMAWYPQARVFLPTDFRSWERTMAEVAGALADF